MLRYTGRNLNQAAIFPWLQKFSQLVLEQVLIKDTGEHWHLIYIFRNTLNKYTQVGRLKCREILIQGKTTETDIYVHNDFNDYFT